MKTPSYKIYLVGGAVRDQLLHYPFADRDWVVVGANPEDLLKQGFQQVGKDFPVFLHPQTKEEYALARKERKQGQGYHGFVCEFGPDVTLEEDLERRDLRINAMAMDDEGNIIDPYQGRQDIEDRLLRHTSPAFAEDPLRILRVARYAARYAHLGFRVAEETLSLMRDMSDSGELQTLSAERLWVEFSRALAEASPATFLRVLRDCGALASLCPPWPKTLDEDRLATLDRAAEKALSVDIRFAISVAGLSPTDCRSLCQTLRCSNSAGQMAALLCANLPLPELANADQVLALLEQFDYLRRPNLLADFCAGAALLAPHQRATLTTLLDAAAAARQVQADGLIVEGFKGKALGQALRNRRRVAVAEAVSHSVG